MIEDCRMCGDETRCVETQVDSEPVALCPTCRGLLERNGRLDATAPMPGGGD